MILCIGEILVDEINGKMHPGGAPFNVSCQINKFTKNVGFLGTIGNDLYGKYLLSFSESQNKANFRLKILKKATTLAKISLNSENDRDFSFLRKDKTDTYIDFKIALDLISKANIIHIGSLIITNENTNKSIKKLIEKSKKENKLISFDINYRNDIFNDKSIFEYYIKNSDILKLSIDELKLFTNIVNYKEALESLSHTNQLIVLTLGSKGSAFYFNGMYEEVNSIKVNQIDSTGAGDSFLGALLYKIDLLLKENIRFNKENLINILRFSNICAALSTQNYGAIDSQVELDEINKYL